MDSPYRHIHVIINPAAGNDEAVLSILNDAFRPRGIAWDVSVTQQFGDAEAFARAALARPEVDLVVSYGGDGTTHEVAQAHIGTGRPMGILPGGTGNGFANENGIPKKTREAAEVLCTSTHVRHVDVARVNDQFFVQRLYTGVEPEDQTSRELKDRYGVLAYAVTVRQQINATIQANYRLTIDGEVIELPGTRCYVVNSGATGSGIKLGPGFQADDGILDVFLLDRNMEAAKAGLSRFLQLDNETAGMYFWHGKEITIDTDPDRPVWTDGEYFGRTPVTISVVPGALHVVVP